MTDAEKALIEACLAGDKIHVGGGTFSLAQKVAMERLNPALIAEYKQKLRAHLRAQREYQAFQAKLPKIVLDGGYGLTVKLYDEIEKEEGWE